MVCYGVRIALCSQYCHIIWQAEVVFMSQIAPDCLPLYSADMALSPAGTYGPSVFTHVKHNAHHAMVVT